MEMRWAVSHLSTCTCSMPNCPSASGCCLSCSEFKFRFIRFEDRVEAFPMLGSIALWATVRKMTFYKKVETRRSSCPECMEVVNCVLLAAAAKTDRRLWQNLVHSSLPCPGRGGEMKGADTDTLCVYTASRQYFAPHFKKHSDTLTRTHYVFTLLDSILCSTLEETQWHIDTDMLCVYTARHNTLLHGET